MGRFVATLRLKARWKSPHAEMRQFGVRQFIKERKRVKHGFDGEARKMESRTKAEKQGFAHAAHVCAYHIWKPKGVSWGCTCSPAPAHQVNWERAVFDCGEDGVDCQLGTQPDSLRDHGVIGWIERRSMALFCLIPGENIVSGIGATLRRVTHHFRRLCHNARLIECREGLVQHKERQGRIYYF